VAATLADDGLLIMDAFLNPIAADGGAAAILTVANQGVADRGAHSAMCLPKDLQDLLKDHAADDLPACVQFRVGNAGYNCRAFVIHPQNVETGQTMVALHFQKDTSVGNSIARVAALYHLTERERQALQGIAAGLTSKEIAAGMSISPNTVKSFLRIIMLKMGVATRVGLVGKLLEYKDNQGADYDA
jgi:DNA-binding CsgD family transcriptional regulator